MIATLLRAGKTKILLASALLLMLTVGLDFVVGHNVSLAALYILPMMLAALVLRPAETFALAVACSYFRHVFDPVGSPADHLLRFLFALGAYFISGLFVTELVRNHELITRHLERVQVEQKFRRNAEEQLRFLVESSPAAILTVDGQGIVLAANEAADHLLMSSSGGTLAGKAIGDYLPVLSEVLETAVGHEGLRTAAQCQGRRDNGDIFAGHAWFSSYDSPSGIRLAAIVVDSSEELREREERGLREMLRANRIVAAAFSHEVRNLCVAMKLLCSGVQDKHNLTDDPDLSAMTRLLESVEAAASFQLNHKPGDAPEPTPLRSVLDNLRIVVEAEWREMGGELRWLIPADLPKVQADPHGLLQALLNLTQNSHRAVQSAAKQELEIAVSVTARRLLIQVRDSGPGVPAEQHLFQAFQPGATGSGLGLYVSRSIVRSFGGDLRYAPDGQPGATFVVELQVA